MKRIFLVLLLVSVASAAGATVRNVPASYATIQAGINSAGSGDTVLVAPGTYVENISFNGKAITVRSASGRDSTFVEAAIQTSPIVTFASGEGGGSVLDGLTVRNVSGSHCISCTGTSPRIRNCRIANAGINGLNISGASPVVSGNLFESNAQYPMWLNISSNPRLESNTYSGNGVQAIALNGGTTTSNKIIYPDNVPYRLLMTLTQSSTQNNQRTLTILPGVTIAADSGTGLVIGSTTAGHAGIQAIGTPDSMITFTSWNGQSGGWLGLRFYGFMLPSAMSYCVIEKGGQGGAWAGANMYYDRMPLSYPPWGREASTPTLSACIVRQSALDGILFWGSPEVTACSIHGNARYGMLIGGGTSPTVTGNSFDGNGEYPIYLAPTSNPQLGDNAFANNGVQAIALQGGTSTVDRTLHAESVPYRLLSTLTQNSVLYNTRTLTISPGVTIAADSGAGIVVGTSQGGVAIQAIGTADSLITFTSWNEQPGGWLGLRFYGYMVACSLSHCLIEKGGQGGAWEAANVFYDYLPLSYSPWQVPANQPSMSNCIIRLSARDGILFWGSPTVTSCSLNENGRHGLLVGGTAPVLTGNHYEGNSEYPIYMTRTANPKLGGDSFVGNGVQAIALQGGTSTVDKTLHAESVPYRLLSTFTQNSVMYYTRTLTIRPGVTIAADSGAGIVVGASEGGVAIQALGTADSQITFTAWNGQAGGWLGLRFYGNVVDCLMEYCVVEKGGQLSAGSPANVYYDVLSLNYPPYGIPSSRPNLSHCTVRESQSDGIRMSGSPIITNSTISNNAGDGIFCGGTSELEIGHHHEKSCQIYNNGGYQLYNASPNPIRARYNYWGLSDSAAIEGTLYDCDDNAAKGCVHFMPFAFSRDVGAVEILSPVRTVEPGSIISPRAIVKNHGWEPEIFPVILRIGSDYEDTAYVSSILARGEVDTLTFAPWTATTNTKAPSYVVACSTALSVDQNSKNDKLSQSVAVGALSEPAIFSISPNEIGNVGKFALEVVGANFMSGAEVYLSQDGLDTLYSDSTKTVLLSPETLYTVFEDLGQLSVGDWSLVVENPDAQVATIHSGLKLIHGRTELGVDIVGREQLRVGRESRVEITYENSGNTQLFHPYLVIELPSGISYRSSVPLSVPKSHQFDSVSQVDGSILLVDLGLVPQGYGGAIDIYLTPLRSGPVNVGVSPDINGSIFSEALSGLPEIAVDSTSHESSPGSPDDKLTSPLSGAPFDRVVTTKYPPAGYILLWQCKQPGRICREPNKPSTPCCKFPTPPGAPEIFIPIGGNHVAVSIGPPQDRPGDPSRIIEIFDYCETDPCESAPSDLVTRELTDELVDPGETGFEGGWRPFDGSDDELAAYGRQVQDIVAAIISLYGAGNNNEWGELECIQLLTGKLRTNCYGLTYLASPILQKLGIVGWGELRNYLKRNEALQFRSPPEVVSIPGRISCKKDNAQRVLSAIAAWSRDPNDKAGPSGTGLQRWLKGGGSFEYVVYFENDSAATLFSDTIWVMDTLSQYLDWSTLSLGQSYPGDGPDSIRPNFSVVTDFDPFTGVITWGLNDINLPPDKPVYPDPTDSSIVEYWGEGWVSYSIRPKPNLPTGTRIENIAGIKFDVNDWILAPMDSTPIFNTIDAGVPTSSILPLPDSSTTSDFTVQWTASDDSAGSGVGLLELYVSQDGLPYTLWRTDTSSTDSAIYDGVVGSAYSFYSIATDNVGHVEEIDAIPDATTYIPFCICPCQGDPICDGVTPDVLDVIAAVEVAFRDSVPMIDQLCPNVRVDVDCNARTDILDVVRIIDVAFRNAAPSSIFCDPCP